MRRSQSSLIEVLLITIGISVCLTLILSQDKDNIESLRSVSIESEEVLINYLRYKPSFYNESFSFLIKQCLDFEKDSYLFNESKRVIELLNNNNSFILFINSSIDWVIYNKKATVCLTKARLAQYELNTQCGSTIITYGAWKGEITC